MWCDDWMTDDFRKVEAKKKKKTTIKKRKRKMEKKRKKRKKKENRKHRPIPKASFTSRGGVKGYENA